MGGWVVLQEPEEEEKVQQKDPHYPKKNYAAYKLQTL